MKLFLIISIIAVVIVVGLVYLTNTYYLTNTSGSKLRNVEVWTPPEPTCQQAIDMFISSRDIRSSVLKRNGLGYPYSLDNMQFSRLSYNDRVKVRAQLDELNSFILTNKECAKFRSLNT